LIVNLLPGQSCPQRLTEAGVIAKAIGSRATLWIISFTLSIKKVFKKKLRKHTACKTSLTQ